MYYLENQQSPAELNKTDSGKGTGKNPRTKKYVSRRRQIPRRGSRQEKIIT